MPALKQMRTCLDTDKWSIVDGAVLSLFLEAFKAAWKCIGNVYLIVRYCSQREVFFLAKLSSEQCLYQSLENEMESDLKVLHWINQLLLNCIH